MAAIVQITMRGKHGDELDIWERECSTAEEVKSLFAEMIHSIAHLSEGDYFTVNSVGTEDLPQA